MVQIRTFMDEQFKHFNAREVRAAARAWRELTDRGGEMLLAMAGAMSTAEIGISLAEMIRRNKVHAVCCTAANLEEDVFNLFAHSEYVVLDNYRDLTPEQELDLARRGLNRVTDTCIPETVMRHTEHILVELWSQAAKAGKPKHPYEFIYDLLDRKDLEQHYQIPPEHSWVLAAKKKEIPIFTPGFEDSTLGNILCARVMQGQIASHHAVRTGTEQMEHLAKWYLDRAKKKVPVGFFQIGGGIAGDFSISVVPMLVLDLREKTPLWAYYAQIGDSTTSYGSYSGAVPNEKITWSKIDSNTPKFMINSDATIVAPLIFAYVLDR